MDEDLSPRIAARLRSLGVNAESVHDLGRCGLSDREQLELAARDERCVVTRNRDDFLLLTEEFFQRDLPHYGVLVVPWTLPPDQFGRVARAIARYVERHADAPTVFLFDYV